MRVSALNEYLEGLPNRRVALLSESPFKRTNYSWKENSGLQSGNDTTCAIRKGRIATKQDFEENDDNSQTSLSEIFG